MPLHQVHPREDLAVLCGVTSQRVLHQQNAEEDETQAQDHTPDLTRPRYALALGKEEAGQDDDGSVGTEAERDELNRHGQADARTQHHRQHLRSGCLTRLHRVHGKQRHGGTRRREQGDAETAEQRALAIRRHSVDPALELRSKQAVEGFAQVTDAEEDERDGTRHRQQLQRNLHAQSMHERPFICIRTSGPPRSQR